MTDPLRPYWDFDDLDATEARWPLFEHAREAVAEARAAVGRSA